MKKFSVLLFSSISLTACGGGGSSGGGQQSASTDGIVSLHGVAKVCAAASGSNAKITVPYGENQRYDVTTNADGSYALAVDTANFKDVNPVVLTVQADKCATENIYVDNLRSGVGTGRIDVAAINMRDLAPGEFLLPPSWLPLTHLGDDQYRGTANSQLQVAATGIATTQPLGVLTQELKDKYKTAFVEFSARGMQTESLQCASYYDNRVGLSASATANSAEVVKTYQPGASDAKGNFTRFSIPINLSEFPVGSTVNFVASSGTCTGGGTDHDDFELTEVVVRFAN